MRSRLVSNVIRRNLCGEKPPDSWRLFLAMSVLDLRLYEVPILL